uniref:HORMA domain-containing protein n=1 Tax=Bursaphelenchus xylophilus TaxID=6326 RepID=A0A1I7SGF2_BURXY
MFEFLHFDDKFPMTPLEVFIQKALMFLLRCTAIYQELQPDRATIHVVTMDGGKVQKFRYELDTATER